MCVKMDNQNLFSRVYAIESEKNSINFSAVYDFAANFKKHLLGFFDKFKNLVGLALNWKELHISDRKKVVNSLVQHAINFKHPGQEINVTFKENSGNNINTLGSIDYSGMQFYSKLMECDDFDRTINTVAHESVHIFQGTTSTTLSKQTVDTCFYNYVAPHESFAHYMINPVEQESFTVGNIVGKDFKNMLIQKHLENSRTA
jgi:hypothetical protein